MSAPLGRFERLTIVELRSWRCHVDRIGCGTVIARAMHGTSIEEYRVRFDVDGWDNWVAASEVRPIAAAVLSFPVSPASPRSA